MPSSSAQQAQLALIMADMGGWKNSMFWFGNNLVSKLFLNSENSETKSHDAEALMLSCSMHPSCAGLTSRQECYFSDCGSPLRCECLLLVLGSTASFSEEQCHTPDGCAHSSTGLHPSCHGPGVEFVEWDMSCRRSHQQTSVTFCG